MISSPVGRGASRKLLSLSDLGRFYPTSTLTSSNAACHCTPRRLFSTGKLAYQARSRTQPSRPTHVISARNATTVTAAKAAIPIKAPVGRPSPALTNNSRLSTDAPPSNPPTSLKEPSVTDLTNPANRRALTDGLLDSPPASEKSPAQIDWSTSFQGLSNTAFAPEAAAILLQPIDPQDIEIKPDGIIYLPEIKYRRILNRAFGPGAWGLAPRGETIVTPKCVTREYGLVVHGRLVSIARGEQQYFDPEGIPTATEGCKSNALMRCCKDLGIASDLWDPVFIRRFMASHSKQVWVEHMTTKKRKLIVMRKDVKNVPYPFKEASKSVGS